MKIDLDKLDRYTKARIGCDRVVLKMAEALALVRLARAAVAFKEDDDDASSLRRLGEYDAALAPFLPGKEGA